MRILNNMKEHAIILLAHKDFQNALLDGDLRMVIVLPI